MRYIVIDVGCLECAGDGNCAAEVKLKTDDRQEAVRAATKTHHSSEYDMFVVDTSDGSVIDPREA